ncbi:MAG: hypothetical protein IH591_19740, partial [Bacteroidales bacterium]|nr:hypothetical protein [Bacteroidales bacterium]
ISTKGIWLLSIRSFAGIEVARVLADSAGVTVLDRIGRIATIYDWIRINKDFGLSYSMLKMIIGDVPGITGSAMIKLPCRDTYRHKGNAGDFTLSVDCDILKPSFIRLHDHDVSISYYDYINERGYFFPGMIAIESARLGSSVKISATDIEIPWYGEASIAIPSNYKIVK